MTDFKIGVVDVFVFRGALDGLRVLTLRRAEGTRCTGAWEAVHGRIEPEETPEQAAVREVEEETGLPVFRLYNVTCQPFYLHRFGAVQLAVVFAAFVNAPDRLQLGEEHDAAEWLTVDQASRRFSWPRSVTALRDAVRLVGKGHAGPVEDVLRVI
jgi:8-oxo-dGTP pyrophosphatase MutT (NUDIX family)